MKKILTLMIVIMSMTTSCKSQKDMKVELNTEKDKASYA